MKQGLKKALVMLLSVAMIFTFMAMPVYADDFTEAEANKVISDAPEAEAAPATEEAEQIAEPEAEAQKGVPIEEEPAQEAVQEEVPEVTVKAAEPEAQEEAPEETAVTAEPVRGDGDEPAAETETISLVPTNEELMFKVVNAFIEKAGDKATLVFALSGNGYEDVISGTYDDAMAAQVGASYDNWIHGEKAEVDCDYWTDRESDDPPQKHYQEGKLEKWQFRVPINDLPETGTIKVPVVAVSKSRYTSAEKANPENPDYSAAFTSRQFVINVDENTVRVGNLKDTINVKVVSNVESFAVNEDGTLYTVGTPKANEYTCQPTITMTNLTYDKAFLGTKEEAAAEGAQTIAIGEDKSFTLGFFNTLGGKQHIVDGKATAAFHVAANAGYTEKDTWVERTFAFDIDNKTVTISGDELTAEQISYTAGEYIVGVKSIKLADSTNYGMFKPTYNDVEGKALVTVAADGSATINYYNARNTYPKIFLAELDSSTLGKAATDEQLADPRCITATTYAGNSNYREFTYSFDLSNLGKTVPYVTLNKTNTFNKAQTAFVFDKTMVPKAVDDVIKLIDALPAAADVTVRHKEVIEAARAAYEALTDDQKAQVTNLNKLAAAEEAFAGLAGKDEATTAVETAIGTFIQQYIDVNDETAAKVAEVRAAYDALTAQQKAYIDDSVLFKLYRAEACVAFANDGIAEGTIYDMAVDTSDNSPFIAATISPRSNAAYVYLYSVAGQYNNAALVSGTVSKSTHSPVGKNKSVLKGLWQVKTTEGQGRTFVIHLTGANGNSDDYTVKVPGVYGVMAAGTYQVEAVQTPSSAMRKFQRSTITSDGTAMTVEFVMPNTTYGKIFLGTKEAAAAATEGFIEPTGTEATSGTTGTGNVYSIPLESMYSPIVISYCNTGKNTWTQETIEFKADEQAQAVIDAIAALNLDTYFNVTADQREQVTAANELYQALNDSQKAIVENSNYSTLKKVVAMFQIADIVAAEIEALPAAENVTKADVDTIRKAKADFDNMGKSDIIKEALGQKPDGTWNTLQNSQIEKLISQELRDKLNACVKALADYSAVDAALEKVPKDLSIYTEDSAKALTDAANAVVRDKLASEQTEVDAMAKAIEDAFKGLVVIPQEVTFTLNYKGAFANGKDGELVIERPVTVTDLDDDKYLTYDEALITAHNTYYEGGAEAGYTCTSYVTKLWGEETSNTLFMLNGEGIPTGVTTDTVKTGDILYASVNADTAYYADWYTKFSETEMNTTVGKDISVHLTGHLGMAYTEEAKQFVPLEGIQIGYWKNGEFKAIEGAVTDKDGNATFKFKEAGKYVLTAKGTVTDVVTNWNLMMLGNNVPPYGTMDFQTYESSVAYTDKDYGDGPYPADEVKFIDFYKEAEEGSQNTYAWQDLHYLKSNNLIADCPIMAPYANLKVEASASGWQKIDGDWYYYDDNGLMVTNEWKKDSKGWCYLGEDGKMVTNDWAKDSKGWVYVGSNGYMVTGTKWMKIDGSWYHITKGYRDESKWMKDSKGWCYLAADGKMVTNDWAKDGKGYCWIGSDGYMVEKTQWLKVDGNWYHITNGYRDQSKWMKDSKGWCYLAADGKMVTNDWAKDGKGYCWIGPEGYMIEKTQWFKIGEDWYHITNGYRDQNKWMKDSKGWCYCGADGKMVTNDWAKDSKGYCWIGPEGYMIEKTQWIGDAGVVGSSYIIDGYRVDNKTIEIEGVKYTFDEEGKLVYGEATKIPYEKDTVNFIKADSSQFGMFTPQDGTTVKLDGDKVVIHYIPKNIKTYAGFNWGTVVNKVYKDESVQPEIEVKANEDGSYDLTLNKDYMGYAHPIAVVKKQFSKESWTSAEQHYLAIPSITETAE